VVPPYCSIAKIDLSYELQTFLNALQATWQHIPNFCTLITAHIYSKTQQFLCTQWRYMRKGKYSATQS